MVQTVKANSLARAQLEELRQLSTCVTANAIETFGVRMHNTGFADSSCKCRPGTIAATSDSGAKQSAGLVCGFDQGARSHSASHDESAGIGSGVLPLQISIRCCRPREAHGRAKSCRLHFL